MRFLERIQQNTCPCCSTAMELEDIKPAMYQYLCLGCGLLVTHLPNVTIYEQTSRFQPELDLFDEVCLA